MSCALRVYNQSSIGLKTLFETLRVNNQSITGLKTAELRAFRSSSVTNQQRASSEASKFYVEMEKTSWICTLITQLSLCFALYIALNLGQPQKFIKRSASTPFELCFLSVKGGFRPHKQQFDLLKQMEKVAKTYKASFVVSTSELGEDDPLMQNATQHFSFLRLPWYTTYTTRASKGNGVRCFEEKIRISNGKKLDIIGVDTELLQDLAMRVTSSGNRKSQLHWLIRTLEASSSNWRIVVGYQPLAVCGENKEQVEKKEATEFLHRTFFKFAVNVYLSGQDCTHHVHEGSVAYIGNPGLTEKEPYSVFLNRSSVFSGNLANGFLLHRFNSLQIVTYYITSAGEVAYKTVLQQKGREFM